MSGSYFVPQGPLINPSAAFAAISVDKMSLGEITNQYITGTLTLAQIQTLYTTPVEILPPLNSTNFMYVIDKFVLEAIYGSASYMGGGNIYLQYGTTPASSSPATGNIASSFLTGLTSNSIASALGEIGSAGLATSVTKGSEITLTNAGGVFGVGTGGSAVYQIFYRVVPVI